MSPTIREPDPKRWTKIVCEVLGCSTPDHDVKEVDFPSQRLTALLCEQHQQQSQRCKDSKR